MSESFSDKPYSSRPDVERPFEADELGPRLRREPGVRLNWRRRLAGFAALFFITGGMLLCFIRGGLLNWHRHWDGSTWVELDEPGHIAGFVLIGLSAVIVVFLFSLEKRS